MCRLEQVQLLAAAAAAMRSIATGMWLGPAVQPRCPAPTRLWSWWRGCTKTRCWRWSCRQVLQLCLLLVVVAYLVSCAHLARIERGCECLGPAHQSGHWITLGSDLLWRAPSARKTASLCLGYFYLQARLSHAYSPCIHRLLACLAALQVFKEGEEGGTWQRLQDRVDTLLVEVPPPPQQGVSGLSWVRQAAGQLTAQGCLVVGALDSWVCGAQQEPGLRKADGSKPGWLCW